ncbi:hypothetical protein QBC40DRAFT_204057 [Triangularia verruculosa]|uniref:Uncharacterized protein n=1 Tax=Triangularia verruculosa TaxID=2587418 RepID=A0AAN6XE23_9PEZI|nr:hypothetical protein QBC40DRAFT_204057 [Triangularia verruculosa]
MCQIHRSQTGCHQPAHPLFSLSVPILIPCQLNCGFPTAPDFLETVRSNIFSLECPYCISNSALPTEYTQCEVDEDFIEELRDETIDLIQEAEYINNTEGIEPTELSLEYEELDLTGIRNGAQSDDEEEYLLTPTQSAALPETAQSRGILIVEGEIEPEDMALTPTDTIVFRF